MVSACGSELPTAPTAATAMQQRYRHAPAPYESAFSAAAQQPVEDDAQPPPPAAPRGCSRDAAVPARGPAPSDRTAPSPGTPRHGASSTAAGPGPGGPDPAAQGGGFLPPTGAQTPVGAAASSPGTPRLLPATAAARQGGGDASRPPVRAGTWGWGGWGLTGCRARGGALRHVIPSILSCGVVPVI